MNKKLFRTKEEYHSAIVEYMKINERTPFSSDTMPLPSEPTQFPALLIIDIKFHRMHESTQCWVYLSDFINNNE